MLNALTLILACQLAGELIVVGTGLPLPGPLIGMVILFAGLLAKGGIPEDLGKVGGVLLANLSLLFVPAGVGIMLHARLMADDWAAIAMALVASSVITISVTAGIMVWLRRPAGTDEASE